MKRKPAEKIQGCDFLLNRRPHAKIQLIWTKKKNRPKFDIEWLCSKVLNCMIILLSHQATDVNQQIFSVTAQDEDFEANAEILYEITDGNEVCYSSGCSCSIN